MTYFDFKKIVVFISCMIIAISCVPKSKEIDKVKIAEDYIGALNASDYNHLVGLFSDSIRFNEVNYIRTFTKEDYHTLFQWDSIFDPSYKILEVREEGDKLHLKVSKECERILFLLEEPFITHEIMTFKEDAIHSIDIVEYVDFDDGLWSRNRENLVSWIDIHHPELSGFIYDQTKEGAMKFRKAMEFYKNRVDSTTIQRKVEP